MEYQKGRSSLLDDDDDDDDEGSEEEDEDLAALQSTPNVSHGLDDGAGSSGADCPMGVMTEESSTRK